MNQKQYIVLFRENIQRILIAKVRNSYSRGVEEEMNFLEIKFQNFLKSST